MKIRRYRDTDKNPIRKISFFTSHSNFSAYVSEGLIEDLLTLYHTDYEPESIFVAEENRKIEGYITGCREIKGFYHIFAVKVIPYIALKILTGKYYVNFRLVVPLIFDLLLKRGEYIKGYPCFLHIDILPGFRNKKLGSKMVKMFLADVCKMVQIKTNTENSGAINFFRRAGFRIKKIEKSYLLSYINKKDVSYVIMAYNRRS